MKGIWGEGLLTEKNIHLLFWRSLPAPFGSIPV